MSSSIEETRRIYKSLIKKKIPRKTISRPLKLESCDKELVDVHWLCALESETIRMLVVNGYGGSNYVIKTEILKDVVDFLKQRAEIVIPFITKDDDIDDDDKKLTQREMNNMLNKFNSKFVKKDISVLIGYLKAASMLCIKSLIDLISTAIVEMLVGKDDHEILEIFMLEKCFTLEEMEMHYDADFWAFDSIM